MRWISHLGHLDYDVDRERMLQQEHDMHTRPEWDAYYLGIADAVSKRGECRRRRVGAVIVKGHTIVATGYNGAPAGEPSCLDGHCPRAASDAPAGKDYAQSGCNVIHAEANAVIRAGRDQCLGATIYVTEEPCVLCRPLIQASGIKTVVYQAKAGYRIIAFPDAH